jgi:hypothetical protein
MEVVFGVRVMGSDKRNDARQPEAATHSFGTRLDER